MMNIISVTITIFTVTNTIVVLIGITIVIPMLVDIASTIAIELFKLASMIEDPAPLAMRSFLVSFLKLDWLERSTWRVVQL